MRKVQTLARLECATVYNDSAYDLAIGIDDLDLEKAVVEQQHVALLYILCDRRIRYRNDLIGGSKLQRLENRHVGDTHVVSCNERNSITILEICHPNLRSLQIGDDREIDPKLPFRSPDCLDVVRVALVRTMRHVEAKRVRSGLNEGGDLCC